MSQTHNFIEFYENDVYYGRALNSIDDLKTYLEDKLFIAVGGGIGSGKSYFVDNVIKKIVGDMLTFDVDAMNREMSDGVYKAELTGKAITKMRSGLDNALKGNQSFIYSGTNSSYLVLSKRLQTAKENNFTTVIIHIDVPFEKAIEQNKGRASTGIHSEVPEDKIIKTNKESKETFEKIKKNRELVDFYFSFKR